MTGKARFAGAALAGAALLSLALACGGRSPISANECDAVLELGRNFFDRCEERFDPENAGETPAAKARRCRKIAEAVVSGLQVGCAFIPEEDPDGS